MDIISHGLWGSITFGRKNKKSFWTAFLFGLAPDFLAFAPLFILIFLGIVDRPPISPFVANFAKTHVGNMRLGTAYSS